MVNFGYPRHADGTKTYVFIFSEPDVLRINVDHRVNPDTAQPSWGVRILGAEIDMSMNMYHFQEQPIAPTVRDYRRRPHDGPRPREERVIDVDE